MKASRPDMRECSLLRLVAGLSLLLGALLAGAFWTYVSIPSSNFTGNTFDAILVLGSPAHVDGAITSIQQARVREAVQEFQAGRAPRILFSGGAAANRFVEAKVMASFAEQLGLPSAAVLQERRSKTTLENIRNSEKILAEHGWRRVEVVSSPEHLRRAAVLLGHSGLLWRVDPAPNPGRSKTQRWMATLQQAIGAVVLRWFGLSAEGPLHAFARTQQRVTCESRCMLDKLQGSPSRPHEPSGSRCQCVPPE